MYLFLLGLHNIMRWLVLIAAIISVVDVLIAYFGKRNWKRSSQTLGLVYSALMGVQLVLGIILYGVSPITRNAMTDPGAAMSDDQTRFFFVEHIALMVLAFVAVQLGYSLSKRATNDRTKYLRASIGYTLGLLLMAFAIPWWRPLLRALF